MIKKRNDQPNSDHIRCTGLELHKIYLNPSSSFYIALPLLSPCGWNDHNMDPAFDWSPVRL